LRGATGLNLPTTLAFDHPNALAIAELLRSEIRGTEREPAAAPLEKLDAILAASDREESRTEIIARMRHLIAKWTRAHENGAASISKDAVDSASDEELFTLLDQELHGASNEQ